MRRAANPWDRFYAAHEAPWRGERQVADLLPLLSGRVLELGVGNGKALRPVRRAGHDVVGLDVSWHVLRRAGEGVLADARRLPFFDGSFGSVLDLHCTGHLDAMGRRQALAEARRVVGPAGVLVQERLGTGDLRAEGRDADGRRLLADGRATWFLSEGRLRAEAEEAGWRRVATRTEARTQRIGGQGVRREHVRLVAYAT